MEDDQQFCLRWNNHQTTLIQNFDTLLESGTLVDCTLAAEGKYLKAHKVVLSACSPYFEGLLSEHYDKHPVFILKDVKFKELKAMMDYMYRGEVNISQDQLAALLKAAESLQIKGLSESRTGGNGCTKPDTRQSKVSSQSTAPSLDIPHASSGLTIEKNSKVPRQSLAQSSVGDLPEDSASPSIPKGISSREGSQSPVSRKRKRLRRRSVGEDNSIENHESNSSDMTQQPVPALGVAPVADEKSHADAADSLGRSALMQQLTKPADEMLQLPVEKPEPTEDMIQPKSEYLDDPEESVEDLTLDDDMNDLNEMEDSNRAGPSSHDPNQHPGLAAWHVTGDRSNAGGVVGSVAGGPGAQDEVFLAAHEAVQAQRDSQDLEDAHRLSVKTLETLQLPMFVSAGITDFATPSTSTDDLSVFTENHIFARANKIENCFPLSWPEDIQLVINEGSKPDDKMRNEIIRKIVRRMEDNGLMQDADYYDVAQRALKKFPILELRTAAGVETLVSQMKRCSKNHVHYLKLQRRKMSAEDTPAKCHEKVIKMMNQEMSKQTPSINVLKTLLIRCRKKRQEDAKRSSSIEMHLQDYPALKFQPLVLNEFEAVVGLSIPELRDRWSVAVPKLVNYFASNDKTWMNKTINQLSVQALNLISLHFKARFGQENRCRHIIEIFEEGTPYESVLPRAQDPPRLIGIGSADSPSFLVSIYIDGKVEFTGTPIDGLIYLHAIYWVFNISYAPEAKVAFTFLGAILLQKRYEKSYRKLKRVLNALENLNLF